ncbi:MAG TPA: squalene/phytoene synthase family protein [Planctomycetota bacterium]|nr:squalene/phytoene synthase family protein [Planctomycetota bacterium]
MLDPGLDPVLAKTSRSFAISLRVLPRATRRAVALAYLFARAADTIADTEILPAFERRRLLQALGALVRTAPPDKGELATRDKVLAEIRAALSGPAEVEEERALLEGLPRAFEVWDEEPALERALTERVLATIVSGMDKDLERFPSNGTVRALETREELFDYCYRVAGCVGEFWTALHRARIPSLQRWNEHVMLERARRFGRALQLTNVLRDVPRDVAHGRCYLPRTELGCAPEELRDPRAFEKARPLFRDLVFQADRDAREGWRYACSIPVREPGLRLATALPLLLAHPTLGLLLRGNPLDPRQKRKVTRRRVLGLAGAAALALPSDAALLRLFKRTARDSGFSP